MIHKNKLYLLILAAILLIGFALRLYRFDSPIADWHSWRQADTSAVSRHFVEHGYDLLHPRFDDLSNIPSGIDNPEGYRFVEFPLYNVAQAGSFQLFGIFTLEQWGRLITIFSSLLAGLFLYLIVSRHSNQKIGLLTAFFYMFIPYNIYYGRTILPDTSMVAAILGGVYFFDKWVELYSSSGAKRSREAKSESSSRQARTVSTHLFFILAILFTAFAFLLKPYALFFTLPMVVLAYQRWGWKLILQWPLWVFVILAVGPLLWWRQWMTQFPAGIPANDWLFNGNGIRFRPSFFQWIGYERLIKLISGYLGIIIFLFGFYKVFKLKEWIFLLSFLVSSVLYTVVFATGNVQHDYYQILIMPSVAIFFGIGSYYLSSWYFKRLPLGRIILYSCLLGLFWFGWNQVRDYFNINNRSIVVAGEAVQRLTPRDAKIIANYTGDTSFLYQTNRKGWPSFQKDLPGMVELGADYLVLVNPTEADLGLGKTYGIVSQTKEYILFDLRKTLNQAEQNAELR